MYKTQIKLNNEELLNNNLDNMYSYHIFVWRFFRNLSKRQFLFRVDKKETFVELNILSDIMPENTQRLLNVKTTKVAEDFFKHTQYSFKLRISPTIASRQNGELNANSKSKSVMVKSKDLTNWIETKLLKFGINY